MIKPTPGNAEVFAYQETSEENEAIGVCMEGGDVADCTINRHRSFEERKANAELIADAFNTYHATGLMPRELAANLSEHKAARIAYAREFPLDAEGEPDVGNIHANIRALKAQRDELMAALENIKLRCAEHPDDDNADRKRNLYHAHSIAKHAITNAKGKTE